jgi:hypothetical protein
MPISLCTLEEEKNFTRSMAGGGKVKRLYLLVFLHEKFEFGKFQTATTLWSFFFLMG